MQQRFIQSTLAEILIQSIHGIINAGGGFGVVETCFHKCSYNELLNVKNSEKILKGFSPTDRLRPTDEKQKLYQLDLIYPLGPPEGLRFVQKSVVVFRVQSLQKRQKNFYALRFTP
jgi:hypothetical protein